MAKRILRTMLFTAGNNSKHIDKAFASDADCVVLDLEDAVPGGKKEFARVNVRKQVIKYADTKYPIMVRLNPAGVGLVQADLDAVACQRVSGFVFPKVCTAYDIRRFGQLLTIKEHRLGLNRRHFDIIALIETPAAVLNAYEIATASPRMTGLLFGSEDFLADMEGSHGPGGRSILCPRHLISMAAKAAGIAAIDTPYVKVRDDMGLRAHISQAKELGYEGMLVMTPSQIEIARSMYTPTAVEVGEAREMVRLASEADEAGRGIAVSDGVFISPPTLKRARNLLSRYEAIRTFEARGGTQE